MIKTLIFDFGDVFINLDKSGAMENALNFFQMDRFEDDMIETNVQYEIGEISTTEFVDFYANKFPNLDCNTIMDAWNYIIKDFPKYRLEFIQKLAVEAKYQLILLSNTNELHINYIKQNVAFYNDFKVCFFKFYLSQEIHLRKPNTDIFQFVLDENCLNAKECLFIDDTKVNTDTARQLGFKIWNIDEAKEDVIHLFETKSTFFNGN
jgi:FMN phosphatase YigB (HAD superfamily)